jgi:hypothetical protein
MLSAEYFRRQAQICRRLSRMATDRDISMKMDALAQQHHAAAEAIERHSAALIPVVAYDASAASVGERRSR